MIIAHNVMFIVLVNKHSGSSSNRGRGRFHIRSRYFSLAISMTDRALQPW